MHIEIVHLLKCMAWESNCKISNTDIFPIWSFYMWISIYLVNTVFVPSNNERVDLSILIPIITPHLSTDTNSKGSSTQLHIRCSQFMLPCFIVYNMYFHWQERLHRLLSSCSWGRFCDYTLTQQLQYWLTPQMCNLWIMWALKMCSAAAKCTYCQTCTAFNAE